jgi:hypothetical protein
MAILFRFRLPALKRQTTARTLLDFISPSRMKTALKILAVDDNPSITCSMPFIGRAPPSLR